MDKYPQVWPDFLKNLGCSFKQHPDFELALAKVFQFKLDGRKTQKQWIVGLFLFYQLLRSLIRRPSKYHPIKKQKQKPGIFIIGTSGKNEFDIIFPVLSNFEAPTHKTTLITSRKCYEEKKSDFITLKNTQIVFTDEFNDEVLSIAQMLFLIKKTFLILFHSIGKSGNNFIRKFIIKNWLLIINEALKLRNNVEKIKSTVNHLEPAFIFSTGDRSWGLYGKLNNLPVCVIAHGHFTRASISRWTGFTPANSSVIYVFGEKYKSFVRDVYPNSHVFAFGNPRYDKVQPKKNIPGKNISITLFLSLHRYLNKAINYQPEFVNTYLKFIIGLYEKFGEMVSIQIKLHHHDSPEYLYQYNSLFGDKIKLIENEDSLKVLEKTDIAFSYTSTTSLESVLSHTYYGQVLLSKKLKFYKFSFAKIIHNQDQASEIIEKFINNDTCFIEKQISKQRIGLEQYLSNIGSATQAISKSLQKLL